MFKKILIISILFIFTIGMVNASENADSPQLENENIYEIDESNYDTYFNYETGDINKNSNITDGDTLKLGNLTDKQFNIDKSLTIMPITENDQLINSLINLKSGSDNSLINGVKMINNEKTSFTKIILINNTHNITITNSSFNSEPETEYDILIGNASEITITNSSFVTYTKSIFPTENTSNVSITNCSFETNSVFEIITNDLTKIEKNESKFEAQLLKRNLTQSHQQIIFIINGVEYTRITDENGTARLAINLKPGNFTIQTMTPDRKISKNNTITVLPRIVENNDLEKFFRNDSQYVIKVLDDNGNPAKAGEIVTFNINGVFYNRTTNESGHVKLNINLSPGEYIITAEYKGCKVSNTITVKSILYADNLIKKYGTPDQFKAKLLDGTGNILKNTNVTFNINGVFYNRTTDEEGFAKLNINLQAGEYIISSMYNGACIANKITVTA